MLINLSEISSAEGKVMDMVTEPEFTEVTYRTGNFPVAEKNEVSWKLSNTGRGKVRIEGKSSIVLALICDRCLDTVLTRIPVDFSYEINLEESDEERASKLDEMEAVEGYQLDADQLLYSEILMNWPAKILCKPDCKGICRKCGQNLNEGACECDSQEYDPRMAAIKDIFNGIS